MSRARYGPWRGGPDPLAPPYDIAEALDQLGDSVLGGTSPRDALRELLRRGPERMRGLQDLRRQIREQRRDLRRSGRLDGTLERVRQLLDQAVEAERGELFPDPSDDARIRETELDTLPRDTARAVRQLSDYDWRSREAREKYDEIRDLLRREVLDQQFRGMKEALEGASPQDLARVREMLADLNAMLDADARGEHTPEQFDAFMARHGEFFPENPRNLEELVDTLARRAAAAQRLLNSLTPEQRDELTQLSGQALRDIGLQAEMAALSQALQVRRPDLGWSGREPMAGDTPLGLGDATTALEELAGLDELNAQLSQDYPGAALEDIDRELLERNLGPEGALDLERLREIERELERSGYLVQGRRGLELSPKAIRRLAQTALRRVFADLQSTSRGDHDINAAGTAGEVTGTSRPWAFGDEQPLDVVRTLVNAVRRGERRSGSGSASYGGRLRLTVDDFEVVETERRTSAAVALCVDLSFSMVQNDCWSAMKQTALALHALASTQFPNDSIEIIGFSRYARRLTPRDLALLDWDLVQGTNLQHALLLAARHLRRHPQAEPVVLVVTDGEPTAHLLPDGEAWFQWPPLPATVGATLREVDGLTALGATINVFRLGDDPRLAEFLEALARRNRGRVLAPSPQRLGSYVVSDYLQARRGARRSRRAS
ncbi:MAG: vWA domain-containing protein [Streptomycetales bacterium]